ncbi:MAG: ribosome biogenesis GTPase YqeH [Erysipelotrichaceae bacterium]|nr:ribosome biogenesis GTPase YqeH [Erysipelotrichaceae bacterium]
MKNCKGCGVTLQFIDKNMIGYSPKMDVDYCQRCFRIKHYDDLTISMKKGIDSDLIIEKINKAKGLIVWVCDLFDFEGSMIKGINRHIFNRDILMVVTKRDLFPKDISNNKIILFVKDRLKELGINVKGVLITSKNDKDKKHEILNILKEYSINNEIVVIGKANAGKSTFLNMLNDEDVLTRSIYPGTTLEFNSFKIDGINFVDTPGIEVENSMLMEVREKDLNKIIPKRLIKPLIYQINSNQSFAIGGLIRLDVKCNDKANVVFYVSDEIKIHRGKLENADNLWKNNKGKTLIPHIDGNMNCYTTNKYYEKIDVVVDGLGFVSINGDVTDISVYYPENVRVSIRKAML